MPASLSSDNNHLAATTLPHPAVVPEYDDTSYKLFGEAIESYYLANNNLRITTLETPPGPFPSSSSQPVATAMDEPSEEEADLKVSNTKTGEMKLDMNRPL